MNISYRIYPQETALMRAEAQSIADAIRTAHTNTPFTNINAVSSWIHGSQRNPRLNIRTDEHGKTIAISFSDGTLPEVIQLLKVSCT